MPPAATTTGQLRSPGGPGQAGVGWSLGALDRLGQSDPRGLGQAGVGVVPGALVRLGWEGVSLGPPLHFLWAVCGGTLWGPASLFQVLSGGLDPMAGLWHPGGRQSWDS